MQWSYDPIEISMDFNGYKLLRQWIKPERPSFSLAYLEYGGLLLLLSSLLPVWGADAEFQYFWRLSWKTK